MKGRKRGSWKAIQHRRVQAEKQIRRESENATCGICGAYCVKSPGGWIHRGPCVKKGGT